MRAVPGIDESNSRYRLATRERTAGSDRVAYLTPRATGPPSVLRFLGPAQEAIDKIRQSHLRGDASAPRRASGCVPSASRGSYPPAGRPTFDVIPTSQPAALAFCTQSDAVRSGTSSSRAMSFTGGRSANAAVP